MSFSGNNRILFLYAEVMGYTVATLKALADLGYEIHVVNWDTKKLTNYRPPQIPKVTFYSRSSMANREIRNLANSVNPAITVVSGVQDIGYLRVALNLRLNGRIVVSGFDTKWNLSPKFLIASLIGKLGFFKIFFSHAWIPGPQQYEFVRKLGFRDQYIISDLYAADLALFANQSAASKEAKKKCYPHQFLFVGRLEPEKGVEILKNAWLQMGQKRGDWNLLVVGSGSLEKSLEGIPGVTVRPFSQPSDLVDVVKDSGCFILPSLREPWGLVVQEFAAAGLPMVLSNKVGAARTFLIPGFNGFSFKSGDVDSLRRTMEKVILQPDERLWRLGQASSELSKRITPMTSAASLSGLLSANSTVSESYQVASSQPVGDRPNKAGRLLN